MADVSPQTVALLEQGRTAGAQGNLAEAMRCFQAAHQASPDYPYPLYEMAWTCLLQDDVDTAYRLYQRVDHLVPSGFFTCKAALDTLRREQGGLIGRGVYKLTVLLEGEPDKAKQKAILTAVVQKWPEVPVAWKMLASLEPDQEVRLRALDTGLRYDPDPQTKGMLLTNKILCLRQLKRDAEAQALLNSCRDQLGPTGKLLG